MADYISFPSNTKELVEDVGHKLNIGTPTTSTTPTFNQICRWLNQALQDIAVKSVVEAVPDLWETEEYDTFTTTYRSIAEIFEFTLPTDYVKFNSVDVLYNESGFSVDNIFQAKRYGRAETRAPMHIYQLAPTKSTPACWLWGNKLYVYVGEVLNGGHGDIVELHYIREPAAILEELDKPELIAAHEPYLILFALAQAKYQDRRYSEAAALELLYNNGLQTINQQILLGGAV